MTIVPHHIKTSQLIYGANQLTGVYTTGKIGREWVKCTDQKMLEQGDSLNTQKMNGCFFPQILWQKMRWFFSKRSRMPIRRGFISKPTEKT